MLTGIHFLLTYTCSYECDHCFLHCSPNAEGTFTLTQIRQILDEAEKLGSIEWIYYEGGEPTLYYPLLLAGLREARERGFKTGIVTNGYFATTVEDAHLWLEPIAKIGINDLSISDDDFHSEGQEIIHARNAIEAARELNMPVNTICIESPRIQTAESEQKGKPVIDGGVLFKGRAAEKLVDGLPRRNWSEMSTCPWEDLLNPQRVHVDAHGEVQICQGISIGNAWETPFSQIISHYRVTEHPILHPIFKGGPAELARVYHIPHETEYVDECHLCYTVRKILLDRFPNELTPRLAYGLT